MNFDAFDSFTTLVDEIGNFVAFLKEAFSVLPNIFTNYWMAILLVLIFVGVLAFIIRLIS